jgi:hypothetical protein
VLPGLGALADGPVLWSVSDEGRTLECLSADGDGYRLSQQYFLDTVIAGLPGRTGGASDAAVGFHHADREA